MSIVENTPSSGRARDVGNLSYRYQPDIIPGFVHAIELAAMVGVGAFSCTDAFLNRPEYFSQHVFCIAFVLITYSWMMQWSGLVTINALMRPMGHADRVIIGLVTAFLFLLSVIHGLDQAYIFETTWMMSVGAGMLGGIMLTRVVAFGVLRYLSEQHVIGRRLAVLAGPAQAMHLVMRLNRDRPYFTELHGVFQPEADAATGDIGGVAVRGGFDDLLAQARRGAINDVIIARGTVDEKSMADVIDRLKELPINVYLASDLVGFDLSFQPLLGKKSQLPLFEVTQRPISGWSSATKRVLDCVLATLALIFLTPLFVIVAIAIKLDTPGPVFFMQKRLGFNNEPFEIYKFRSMRHNAGEEPIVRQATKRDPRVTRIGRIIRATSVDELPQLLNVLDGSMSLVGPRPHALSHNLEYGEQIRGYFARHKVKPGITGWAQVNGFRGETPDLELMRRRVEHDVFYTENWSILFDLRILVTTVIVVLLQKSAY
jgi:Undecaprenyl-phosphate glucose phosphotransferase